MRSSFALAFASLAVTLAACGGPDDDDGSTTIDASRIDAPPGAIDAAVDAPMAMGGLGSPCTGTGQGNCATGFECLSLTGGSGSWCSKTCTGAQDTSCGTGYTGSGFAACFLSVTPAGGGTARLFCGIICEDLPGAPNVCPGGDTQCNRMCPAPLMCTANLTTMPGGPTVARACN